MKHNNMKLVFECALQYVTSTLFFDSLRGKLMSPCVWLLVPAHVWGVGRVLGAQSREVSGDHI